MTRRPPDLKLRGYRREDATALAALFQLSVTLGTVDHYSAEEREAWAISAPAAEHWHSRLEEQLTLIAEDATRIVGFMTLTDDGCIALAYVHPEHLGTGVAAELYDAIEQAARARGLERLTSDASHLARRFFERRGWSVLAPQTVERRGVRLTNFRMEKKLSAVHRSRGDLQHS